MVIRKGKAEAEKAVRVNLENTTNSSLPKGPCPAFLPQIQFGLKSTSTFASIDSEHSYCSPPHICSPSAWV